MICRDDAGPGKGDPAEWRDLLIVDADPRRAAPAHPTPASGLSIADEDRALVAALLRKDRKAAARLVAAHADAVYAYVRHRLMPRTDFVDDVVQEVFLAALRGLATFKGSASLRGWLLGIARHKVDDLYRQQFRAPEPLPDDDAVTQPASDDPSLEDILDTARARERTRAVLARLPERYGFILIWRYWEQRTTREIASTIGATEKGVERMLARARARFRAIWLQGE
jgi:RNA polymerase sigma-70 factor (ECF subfamily)